MVVMVHLQLFPLVKVLLYAFVDIDLLHVRESSRVQLDQCEVHCFLHGEIVLTL
jgi:hypothetical protein